MTSKDIGAVGSATGASRATLADVARLANVSAKTVSRALSGAPNVDPATRARVTRAAATLRFRPNVLARGLRSGGLTDTVGFVIGDLTNPFYAHVAAGVERVLAQEGFTLVLAATEDEPDREAAVVAAMLERQVRALLLVPISADHAYLEGERQYGSPVVAVDRPLDNATSDSVVFDNRDGARAGVLALLDSGHSRVAFVGSSTSLYTHRERLLGYRDALADRGVPFDDSLVRTGCASISAAKDAATDLLAAGDAPTAVFAGNNRASIGVLQATRERGARVGLVGFDDFELAEALGLTVVSHAPEEMGEVAARIALNRIEDPMAVVKRVVLPTRVILRGSERRLP